MTTASNVKKYGALAKIKRINLAAGEQLFIEAGTAKISIANTGATDINVQAPETDAATTMISGQAETYELSGYNLPGVAVDTLASTATVIIISSYPIVYQIV